MHQPDLPAERVPISNQDIAPILEQVADLLEIQEANYYRIRAYREAAQTIRALENSVAEILHHEGTAGLEKLPHIGPRLARSLVELLQTGDLRLRQQLLAAVSPADRFITIPGIGKVLAHRISQTLGIETLEDLEWAAHSGQLEAVQGFGPRRTRLVREALEGRLRDLSRQRARLGRWRETRTQAGQAQPSVALLLAVDAQYRHLAETGQLRTIAPRRFNPEGKRWLPILHLNREGWQFSVLYSNTARAHELGKTHDWVVIYYERDGQQGQCTVVTETRGARRGRRVVRGQATAA